MGIPCMSKWLVRPLKIKLVRRKTVIKGVLTNCAIVDWNRCGEITLCSEELVGLISVCRCFLFE